MYTFYQISNLVKSVIGWWNHHQVEPLEAILRGAFGVQRKKTLNAHISKLRLAQMTFSQNSAELENSEKCLLPNSVCPTTQHPPHGFLFLTSHVGGCCFLKSCTWCIFGPFYWPQIDLTIKNRMWQTVKNAFYLIQFGRQPTPRHRECLFLSIEGVQSHSTQPTELQASNHRTQDILTLRSKSPHL